MANRSITSPIIHKTRILFLRSWPPQDSFLSIQLFCPVPLPAWRYPQALTPTLTTAAFDRSSLGWFEARSWKLASKGPPSSLTQLMHAQVSFSFRNLLIRALRHTTVFFDVTNRGSNSEFLPEYAQFEQPRIRINHPRIKDCGGRSGVDGNLRVGSRAKMRRA